MTVRGITFLLVALLTFTVQDAIVKLLTETHAVVQILTWRILAVVFMLGCVAVLTRGWSFLKTTQLSLMLLRGFFAFTAFTNYYFALSYIPLADGATILMTAPLIITALSVPFLGERVGPRRWSAVIIGFSGVVLMLNPGSGLFRPIMVLPLASAFFYAFIPILTRKIDARESTLTIAFYTSLSYALLCLVMTLAVHLWPATDSSGAAWSSIAQPWTLLSSVDWMLVFLASVLFSAGVLCITAAYRASEASVLAPFEYSYLLWATLIGFLVFSDIPTLRTWLAGFIIAGSGIYIALREQRIVHEG